MHCSVVVAAVLGGSQLQGQRQRRRQRCVGVDRGGSCRACREPGYRRLAIRAEDDGMRPTAWPWRRPRGGGGSELPGGGGDSGMVGVHEGADGVGATGRAGRQGCWGRLKGSHIYRCWQS
ncbi:hypothetical protein KSP40_PGU008222 [Platanthera guangdongensis]|uniref:Uncharacterized protein n=1 Tax=Platanthera guangdongensis TaxID=2320717 RepID=A0ABR2M4J1_9ASPA